MTQNLNSILREEVSKGCQDVVATRTYQLGEYKVRLTVRSDPYDFQCEAHADVWSRSALKWQCLTKIPFSNMSTPTGLASHLNNEGLNWHHFEQDMKRLLTDTAMLLDVDLGAGLTQAGSDGVLQQAVEALEVATQAVDKDAPDYPMFVKSYQDLKNLVSQVEAMEARLDRECRPPTDDDYSELRDLVLSRSADVDAAAMPDESPARSSGPAPGLD